MTVPVPQRDSLSKMLPIRALILPYASKVWLASDRPRDGT
jgi:hypothetical protein